RDWLGRHPRFHLHFTPTGSSWINQVERGFGLLTEQLIRRGVHKSVVALEHDVRQWIKNWNDDPKPFVWTKTAEGILHSLSIRRHRNTGELAYYRCYSPEPVPLRNWSGSPADAGAS